MALGKKGIGAGTAIVIIFALGLLFVMAYKLNVFNQLGFEDDHPQDGPGPFSFRAVSDVTNGSRKISVTNRENQGGSFKITATFPYASGSNTKTWTIYIKAMDTWTTQGYDSKIVDPINLEVYPPAK